MATNYDKFEYDLLQADSLDDYFIHLDAGQNVLPIGGIQLDDLPVVKIGTPEAKDVREILGCLPVMLRNIKNSYLTVDLMPSGIAYDNTSITNVLLIKLDIATWFNLLYSTAKREELVTSIAELAKARDKTAELKAKLTNYENKTTNDALRDADEQLNHADNSTKSTSEALEKLEHDNLVDHLGKASPQEDEHAKDGEAAGSDQASASNKDDLSDDHKPTADNNAENQANHENDENSQDATANSDTKNPDDSNELDDLPMLDHVTESDDENQANHENDENNQDATTNSDTKNPDDSNELDDLPTLDHVTESDDENQDNSQNTESTNNADGTDALLNGVENHTESDDENQDNSQNTESTNNANSAENNTDGDNASSKSELDNLEKERLSHNVTNRPLSAEAQIEMAKPNDKLQQVKTAAENAKANINPESQADVPSVKMQTPPVQVTNYTGQDPQTQLLTKMMETLNLVLKRETKKDKDTQAPKAVSELTPKERLANFRSEQDQLIASMIAKQI